MALTAEYSQVYKNRPSSAQIESLVSFMEAHTLFARKQITKLGSRGHETYNRMWEELTVTLNSVDGVKKSTSQWKKTWDNLRLNSKKRKAEFMKAMKATGNTKPTHGLSDIDERISSIFGKYGTGDSIVDEIGVPKFYDVSQEFRYNYLTDSSRNVPSAAQKQHLLTFMEQNVMFARGNHTPELMQSTWQNLVTELNAIADGCTRSIGEWKKSWSETKTRVLQKAKENSCSLKPSQEKILQIIGYRKEQVVSSTTEPSEANPSASAMHTVPSTSGINSQSILPPSASFVQNTPSLSTSTSEAVSSKEKYQGFKFLLNFNEKAVKRKLDNSVDIDLTVEDNEAAEPPTIIKKRKTDNIQVLLEKFNDYEKYWKAGVEELRGIKEALQQLKPVSISTLYTEHPNDNEDTYVIQQIGGAVGDFQLLHDLGDEDVLN